MTDHELMIELLSLLELFVVLAAVCALLAFAPCIWEAWKSRDR